MSKIQVLKDNVINQIAAGEIIERPYAVVRELVDNALDAKSEHIKIILENGGLSRIEVHDDGVGILDADLDLAITRHATSKIRSEKDLDNINSLGFRGEALASIASVSKFSLESKSINSENSKKITLFGGSNKIVKSGNRQDGTSVVVENIFFNVPARKKFLKKPNTEESKVVNWIKLISLTRPDVAFTLISDSKEVLKLPKESSVENRAKRIYKDKCYYLEKISGDYKIHVYLSHPTISKSKSTPVLVNNRVISDISILRAIKDAYGNTLKGREYPVGFVHLIAPSYDLDVNVHPQKSEVRFRNQQFVFRFVMQSVRECLTKALSGSENTEIVEKDIEVNRSYPFFNDTVPQSNPNITSGDFAPKSIGLFENSPSNITKNIVNSDNELKYKELRYRGRIFKCYLLCELENNFYVVDMHAAHERVNYNIYINSIIGKSVVSQKLLIPEVLNLEVEEVQYLTDNKDLLFELGFEIDALSKDSIAVRSFPAIINKLNIKDFFSDILNVKLPSTISEKFKQKIDAIAARLACHASLRSGDEITKAEVYELFDQLDKAIMAGACPHGRPILKQFSKTDIEKWFGRVK